VKNSMISQSPIVGLLKEVELGAKVGVTCRKHGITEPTYHKRKTHYNDITVSHHAGTE
jgi:putative transposase